MARSTGRGRPGTRRRSRRRRAGGLPRGVAMGLVLLACAALVVWYFREPLERDFASPPPAAEKDTGSFRPRPARPAPPASPAPAEDPADRFEFYDMLPDAEVRVPVQPKTPRPASLPDITDSGTYVLQAGAFPRFADADRVKARLALLGIVSEIQEARADGSVFHRVRVGPVTDLRELNRVRNRLHQNGIDFVVIPVDD